MIIEKTTAYKVGDQCFPSVEAAQRGAITVLFEGRFDTVDSADICNAILEVKEKLLAILSLTPTPAKTRKQRSDKGTKRAARDNQDAPGVKVAGSGKYSGQ